MAEGELNFKLFERYRLHLPFRTDLMGKLYKVSVLVCLFSFFFLICVLPGTTFFVLTHCFALLWGVISQWWQWGNESKPHLLMLRSNCLIASLPVKQGLLCVAFVVFVAFVCLVVVNNSSNALFWFFSFSFFSFSSFFYF